MKAVVVEAFGPPQAAQVRDWPLPAPGAGEVLIEVHAIGVNFPDLLTVAGKYQNLPGVPFVPGKEAAGVVLEVGAGVRRLRVGERVMAQRENGAFAEQIAVREEHCFPMPDALPMLKAAALGLTYQTAWFGLFDRGALQPGETVLVTGASGGVGAAAVQLAKAAGCRVLAGVSSPDKAEFVRGLGADGVVRTGDADLRDSVRRQVHDQNYGQGADLVIESVGGPVFDACLRALAWSGRLVVVGFAGGDVPSLKANYLLIKHISVCGLHWSDYRDAFPERMRDAQARIFGFWREGRLDPPVTAVLPLEHASRALETIAARRALGKLVLETACGRAARGGAPRH
ncbi:MAG TPA: NADPH:quinone oxidoreductase family protein [Rubrivivax sp.]|nr:NADPH:quinone oxidoreductase family protein [Rubrivivax sp.]